MSPSDLLSDWSRLGGVDQSGGRGQSSGAWLDPDIGTQRAKAGSSQVLQKWKEPLFHNIENRSKKEGERKKNEKLVSQLSAIIFCDELPSQLDGPRHGLEFFICIQDSP